MKRLALLFVLFQSLVCGGVASAYAQAPAAYRTVSQTSWVEEWDTAEQRWVRVAETSETKRVAAPALPLHSERTERRDAATYVTTRTYQAARYAVPAASPVGEAGNNAPLAHYGPFIVLDENRAAMVGPTNDASPYAFDAMLRDFPGVRTLDMIEAPGTTNDLANLAVGRRIRAAGIATHVPRGGSVRSGAVELFLAGVERSMADTALFAVHAWLDNYGREPADFAPDAPENRLYIDYYMEMGMSEDEARAFYAMTNSVPHESAKWLNAKEMREWVRPGPAVQPTPSAPPVVLVATITAQPLRAPVQALPIPAFEPAEPIILAQPTIGHQSVTQIAWVQPDLVGGHSFLDS